MIIVGAGMSGLIAANYFRASSPKIIEHQLTLPNNHQALLRFRSSVIGDITGIPFKKVKVNKAIVYDGNFLDKPNVFVCNMYSQKVTGGVFSRSIWDIDPCERYIAPPNLVERLAGDQSHISYGKQLTENDINLARESGEPIISTIPMNALMALVGYEPKSKFNYRQIYSITVDIAAPEIDIYQTIYYPSVSVPEYRASFCGSRLIIELSREPESPDEIVDRVLHHFGIEACVSVDMIRVKPQRYGKIIPIDDKERTEFMYMMTRQFNIYSLGRFATWRPILLDDLAKDLGVIRRLIENEQVSRDYAVSLSTAR